MDDTSSAPTTDRVVIPANALLDDGALHELLERLAVLARHAVGDAQAVSVTVVEDGGYKTINSTGPDALAIDDGQYRDDAGPCLEAIRTARQLEFAVGDTAQRWPSFAAEAEKAGMGAVLSTPLIREKDEAIGGLNIYARHGGSFRPADRRSAELISEQAAVLAGFRRALRSSLELNDQLRQAVQTRQLIGTAMGILMERQGCTSDQAFDMLRRASQRENRKLRDVAEDLVVRVETHAPGQASKG